MIEFTWTLVMNWTHKRRDLIIFSYWIAFPVFIYVCVWFYCRNRVVDVECHLISGAFSLSLEKYLEDNIIFRRDFFKSWSKKPGRYWRSRSVLFAGSVWCIGHLSRAAPLITRLQPQTQKGKSWRSVVLRWSTEYVVCLWVADTTSLGGFLPELPLTTHPPSHYMCT